jgi:predicted dehydrogenase
MSRRTLMRTAAQTAIAMSALSYSRILGANDRMQIGQIGCGYRGAGLRRMLKRSAQADPNFDLRSVCELWSVNRERAADHAQELFGRRPKTYKYSEEMLADPDLDAVMIATGDHQHARILAEVVRAGKDCYCEKPMANTLEDAVLARDAVKASDRVVQVGSQWLSDPYQPKVRDMLRAGKLGKIVSIGERARRWWKVTARTSMRSVSSRPKGAALMTLRSKTAFIEPSIRSMKCLNCVSLDTRR